MAGKHAQKGSNAPLVILIVVAVIVVAAIVGGVIFFMNGGMSLCGSKETQPATAAPETTLAVTAGETRPAPAETKPEEQSQEVSQGDNASQAETGVHAEEEGTINVLVPMEDGIEPTYFNASYVPNGKVDDTSTGQSVTLREVFGNDYNQGVLTFEQNGTFSDTLVSGEHNRGAYVVQNDKIHATYTNDKNMIIEVSEWDGGAPVRFTVLYGSFLVYFGEDQ